MNIAKLALTALCLMSLVGCGPNRYETTYSGNSMSQIIDAQNRNVLEPSPTTPSFAELPPGDGRKIRMNMFFKGYIPVGMSRWEGGTNAKKADAVEQAKKIGAHVVLVRSDYLRTEKGVKAIPIYIPSSATTTYHSGIVNSGRYSGNYSGTSTTYNPARVETIYQNYSRDKYLHTAVYFSKLQRHPETLETHVVPIPDDVKNIIT